MEARAQRLSTSLPMARRKAKAASKPAKVTLQPAGGDPIEIRSSTKVQQLAVQWSYVVRNRGRWTTDEAARDALAARAVEDLERIGVSKSEITRLASAGLIEVGLQFEQEADGWETRVFPWEHLLHFATRTRRRAASLLVVRRLERKAPQPADAAGAPLFVESAPPKFAERFWFESERYGVLSPFGVDLKDDDPSLHNPTQAELERAIKSSLPAMIHLAGVDAHEGAEILKLPPDKHRRDGYYLSDADRQPVVVEAELLAKILTAGKKPPRLVTANFYHSGPRIAGLAVAHGAAAAVGIQDTIDNSLAELFFSIFYEALASDDELGAGELAEAFAGAFQQLRSHAQSLRGAGILLWAAESIANTQAGIEIARELTGRNRRGFQRIQKVLEQSRSATGASDQISVHVVPNREINYSLLHNRRNLFQTFELSPRRLGKVDGVDVDVELHVHGKVFPFRGAFTLDKEAPRGSAEHPDINEQIRVPLTWSMLDHSAESIQTTLYAHVRQRGETLLRRTYPVTLLPPSEWKDNKTDGVWLPSFVLPRDSAVERVLDHAVRHLRVLSDNPAAGFSGYQTVCANDEENRAYVDLQVRAIWSALQHDFDLTYINPPPSYSQASQRLRRPSEVLENRRGTCIDLALLVAACLEYVDIYPVIFLLTGHAFPGYWRDWALHQSFSVPEQPDASLNPEASGGEPNTSSWMAGRRIHAELLARIDRAELIPLETTFLTKPNSYEQARKQGLENLVDESRFDAMLDIRRARTDPQRPITPLPLRNLR